MIKIIEILIGVIIVNMISIIFIKYISKAKIKTDFLTFIIAFVVLAFIHTLISIYLTGIIKTITILITYTWIYRQIFKISFGKILFLIFEFFLLVIVADTLVTISCLNILKIDSYVYYNVLAGSVFFNVVVSILILILMLIFTKSFKKINEFKISFDKALTIYVFLTLICITFFFWNGFSSSNIDINFIVNFLLIIVFAIILFSLITQIISNRKLLNEYDNLIKYVQVYEDVLDKERIHSHENRNQLLTIKGKLIDREDVEKVIKYIDNLTNETTNIDKIKYSKLKYLPANGLKGLLYFKLNEAEKKGISVTISLSKSIANSILNNLNTENYKQLCRIVGVYLDNAIEASSTSNKKLLGIEIYSGKNEIDIIISNSYNNEIDINKLANSRYSTKGKNRGYGLLFVKSIIGSSNVFKEEKEITEELYIQKLTVK